MLFLEAPYGGPCVRRGRLRGDIIGAIGPAVVFLALLAAVAIFIRALPTVQYRNGECVAVLDPRYTCETIHPWHRHENLATTKE